MFSLYDVPLFLFDKQRTVGAFPPFHIHGAAVALLFSPRFLGSYGLDRPRPTGAVRQTNRVLYNRFGPVGWGLLKR